MTNHPNRTKRRTADIEAVAWGIFCPGCGEDIPSPSGSLMWTLEDRREAKNHNCPICQTRVRVPVAKEVL